MDKKWINIVGGTLIAIIVLLIGIRIVFHEKFENFDKYIEARDSYKGDKNEFDKNFEGMTKFIENYKKQNPGATDEEVGKAFSEALGN